MWVWKSTVHNYVWPVMQHLEFDMDPAQVGQPLDKDAHSTSESDASQIILTLFMIEIQ